ncbi:MAG TPA: SgcJ/EcaC family oxidoreductase, partial [Polyangia bacterium]|nr:SgcJ/EcaC family oxidoreductase [Polyangia bacterium]
MPGEIVSPQGPDDRAAIRAVVESWHRATTAGEIARVLPLMTDDAVFLTHGHEPMRGRAAFERTLAALLETHTIASSGIVREVEVSGDLAYAWTDLTVTVSGRDGQPPMRRTGPTL